jgi:transcriptional regulator with XRE-family HTH domain
LYSNFVYPVKVVHADVPETAPTLPPVPVSKGQSVGERLRQLRKAKGLTQTQLGKRVGVSQRVVTYYENEGGSLGPELLSKFAKALGVSADTILGNTGAQSTLGSALPDNLRLWRKLKQVETLSPPERRQVVQLIDALVERSTLKRQKAS